MKFAYFTCGLWCVVRGVLFAGCVRLVCGVWCVAYVVLKFASAIVVSDRAASAPVVAV